MYPILTQPVVSGLVPAQRGTDTEHLFNWKELTTLKIVQKGIVDSS